MEEEFAQGKPRFLSTRQHLHLLVDVFAREQEGAQQAAQLLPDVSNSDILQGFQDRHVAVQLVGLVLGVVSDVHVVPHIQGAGRAGLLLQEHAGEGGFPCAVFADQGHFLLTGHDEVQPFKHRQFTKALFQRLCLEDDFAGAWCRGKAKSNLGVFRGIHFHAFQLVELLDQTLRKSRLVLLGPEFVDELLGVLDVLLLVLRRLFLPAALFLTPHLVLGIGPLEVVELDAPDFHGALRERVQEHAVVRNEQDGPRMVNEQGFQPLDAFDVQVVGRFVKQQQVGLHDEKLGQLHAHFPSAAEFRHRAPHVLHLESQALQNAVGLLLGAGCTYRVESFVGVAQLLNQVGVAVAFVVRALRHFPGQSLQALFQKLHLLKGLHGHFQNGGGLVVFHLLGEVADAVVFGSTHRAGRRLLVSGDDLQEGGLACAVASDQADAVLVSDGQIQPLKQRAFTKVNPDRQQVQHGHASSTSGGQKQKRAPLA